MEYKFVSVWLPETLVFTLVFFSGLIITHFNDIEYIVIWNNWLWLFNFIFTLDTKKTLSKQQENYKEVFTAASNESPQLILLLFFFS
jgi:hypothetical protein